MFSRLIKRYQYLFNLKLLCLTLLFCLFILLLFKDPYSERTLIPNLDPFPDTLHYLVSARSLIQGKGWYLEREGRTLQPGVPPLYPIILSPIFLFSNNPVNYYFINILLSISSWLIFFLIIKRITKNLFIIFLVILLYTTNYFVYWVPSLAMAENLSMTLFLLSVLIMISPISSKNLLIGGFTAVAIYSTKYAHIIISISLLISLVMKLKYSKPEKGKINKFIVLLFSFIIALVVLIIFESSYKSRSTINTLLSFLSLLIPIQGTEKVGSLSSNSWFSYDYLKTNLPQYLHSLVGDKMRFLWDYTPLFTRVTSILGLSGLLLGISFKYLRVLIFYLLSAMIGSIIFLSTFYSVDARYIYYVIPILLIGLILTLEFLMKTFQKKRFFFKLFLLVMLLYYIIPAFPRIKSQMSLNLKYAETPWSYKSTKLANNFLNNIHGDKVLLISPLPPYYIDYFIDKKIKILPLSPQQEFRFSKEEVWGVDNYSDFTKLYKKYINDGYALYLSDYGLGNEGYLHKDFEAIAKNFNLTLISSNCFNVCNIYKVDLRKN